MSCRVLLPIGFLLLAVLSSNASEVSKPNILIVTVDDMNCDSVGVFGCKLANTTPNIDQLASLGLRYTHAHVQTGSCNPSRNVLFSGRYSHNTGVEGFYDVPDAEYPHLVDVMKAGGYFVEIANKVSHSTPYHPYAWDADLSKIDGQDQQSKEPASYFRSTKLGIERARDAGKPFCLNINISDPHKPFYGLAKGGQDFDDPFVPTRIFSPNEVPVPGYLIDHPNVRKELAHYYSSVRRADDCVGQILKALDESGAREQTMIVFLSDHGMPLPFAKTDVLHHSTHTPWIVVWQGVTNPGQVDEEHMISAVDLLPTLLDVIQGEHPSDLDGRSFLPTIRGEQQSGREIVYKFHNENSGRNRSPMRSVESRTHGYIFSPWVDGKRVFQTATRGTMTFKTMRERAEENEAIAKRLDLYEHGAYEQFYDYEHDPDALVNLIDDPKFQSLIDEHREAMRNLMVQSNDPLLAVFDRRDDREFVSGVIDGLQAESDVRAKASRKSKQENQRRQNPRLFKISVPDKVVVGEGLKVTVDHRIPKAMGTQPFFATVKDQAGKRIERREKSASGVGAFTFEFAVDESQAGKNVKIAVFIGPSYQETLLHRTAGPVNVVAGSP